MNTKIAKKV